MEGLASMCLCLDVFVCVHFKELHGKKFKDILVRLLAVKHYFLPKYRIASLVFSLVLAIQINRGGNANIF